MNPILLPAPSKAFRMFAVAGDNASEFVGDRIEGLLEVEGLAAVGKHIYYVCRPSSPKVVVVFLTDAMLDDFDDAELASMAQVSIEAIRIIRSQL